MGRALLLLSLFLLAACHSHKRMTMERFLEIDEGSSIAQVKQQVGVPYKIEQDAEGFSHYIYIERIDYAERWIEQTHYDLKVSETGEVLDKSYEVLKKPFQVEWKISG